MTNEKAIHTLAHYDLSAASDLHEAINMAIAALRTPPATGAAMREAHAAKCDEVAAAFDRDGDDREEDFRLDAEYLYFRAAGARACAAAIRALPAPEVPEAVKKWCERWDGPGVAGSTSIDFALRDWTRKEYGL